LCCLFFSDIRFLITPLVSSNSSYGYKQNLCFYGFSIGFWNCSRGLYFWFFSPFYYFITPNEHCYQLYHAEYKLHFNDMMMMLDYYSARSLTPLSMGRHVTPLVHNIMIPSQPLFALPTT
jgi:hypothetical protein